MLRPKKKITKREIKHDALLETFYKAQKYYEQYHSRVLAILGVVVGAILITWLVFHWKQSSENAASTMLSKALLSYQQGNYNRATRLLEPILSEYPNSRAGSETLFYLGKISLDQGNITLARQYFNEYLDNAKNPFLISGALGSIGYTYEVENNFGVAGDYYDQAAQKSKYSFQKQQNEIIAIMNWIKAGEYDKAQFKLEALEEVENLSRQFQDNVNELRSQLNITLAHK